MASSTLRNSSGDTSLGDLEPSKDNGTMPEDIGSKPADNGTNKEDNGINPGDNKAMNTRTNAANDIVIAEEDGKEMAIEPVIKVDMPGLRLGGVKVEIGDDGWLSISGQRKEEEVEETDKSNRADGSSGGMFHRNFELPQCVDTNKVTAQMDVFHPGVLIVIVANNETRNAMLRQTMGINQLGQRVPPKPRSKLKWKETAAEHLIIADLPENVDMENLTVKVTSDQLTVIVPKVEKLRHEPEVADTSTHGSIQLQSNTQGAEKTPGSASGS